MWERSREGQEVAKDFKEKASEKQNPVTEVPEGKAKGN